LTDVNIKTTIILLVRIKLFLFYLNPKTSTTSSVEHKTRYYEECFGNSFGDHCLGPFGNHCMDQKTTLKHFAKYQNVQHERNS